MTRYFRVASFCAAKDSALLILDFRGKKKLRVGETLSLSLLLSVSLSFVHSRLRRPREWPRIMTLLRGRSQLMAIKTLVIAVGELRNYHVTAWHGATGRQTLRFVALLGADFAPIISFIVN